MSNVIIFPLLRRSESGTEIGLHGRRFGGAEGLYNFFDLLFINGLINLFERVSLGYSDSLLQRAETTEHTLIALIDVGGNISFDITNEIGVIILRIVCLQKTAHGI